LGRRGRANSFCLYQFACKIKLLQHSGKICGISGQPDLDQRQEPFFGNAVCSGAGFYLVLRQKPPFDREKGFRQFTAVASTGDGFTLF